MHPAGVKRHSACNVLAWGLAQTVAPLPVLVLASLSSFACW